MGNEKQSSRGGNYVGGFLQMFDWNAKSRKKLFSGKLDAPGRSKQKKRCDGNLPTTRIQMMEVDEITAGSSSSIKEGSDYSCSSSMMDEDFYERKRVPSVVARLMGLDSMPKSTPLFDSVSLHSPSYYHHQEAQETKPFQDRPTNSGYLQDLAPQTAVRLNHSKTTNRPIEKFQTEVLPPKSAKSIPVTQHKLLSPIKSAYFNPSADTARMVEAAARIIELGPTPNERTKLPSVGSSLGPLRVSDLKEKARLARKPPSKVFEGSQRKVEAGAVRNLKGQSMDNSLNRPVAAPENMGKSMSLALQAKANVKKREGLNVKKKETCEKSPGNNYTNLFRSQPVAEKHVVKKPCGQNGLNVLRQNNQKQNCIPDGGKPPVKSSSKVTKSKHGGTSRVNSSKKSGSEVKDDKNNKVLSSASGFERVARKKRCVDGNYHSEKGDPFKNGKGVGRDEDKGKTATDVISFTFTAPMTRSGPGPTEGNKVFSAGSPCKRSHIGHNTEGGDALSSVLEEKLQELARKVEFSKQKSFSIMHDVMIKERTPVYGSTMLDVNQEMDEMDIDNPGLLEESSITDSNISQATKSFDCRLPSPVSILDLSLFAESYNSSDTADSNSVGATKICSSIQAKETLNMYSSKMFLTSGGDATELSDSASSNSIGTIVKTQKTALNLTNLGNHPRKWELLYVNEILSNVELMCEEYAVGQSHGVIKPQLFDQLEISKGYFSKFGEVSTTDRRLLFDGVSECLDLRCKSWAKGASTVKRKERLADEVCKEISSWSGVGDSMIDGLVDKDMSSRHGKWLDFETEAFDIGIQIETRVLNSLIDELVADMLRL